MARRVLSVVQTWLADERLASGRLVLLTHGAVAVQSGEPLVQLEASPAWGLVRSAQAEHPGRFVLVDTDSQTASLHGLLAEIEEAIAEEESQLAIRHGVAYAPRLIRISDRAPRQDHALTGVTPAIDAQARTVVGMADGLDTALTDAQGTVLITGGTGGLGGALALNLVIDRGVRHLVLVSRRGLEAEGALELQAQLQEHGAHVRIAACDVSDRDELRAAIESISAEHPLKAVVHTAGITDNALVDSLTIEQLEQVLTTKADGALLLHELTIDHELDAFVLFSSMAGVTGGPGQGNYAAANAFLDALACQRRAQGLPATSLAWGLWSDIGMGRSLGEAEMKRMAGTASLGVISPEEGLAMFGPALASGEAVVLPVRLDRAVLRSEAKSGALPPLIRGLADVQVRKRSSQSETLSQRLAGISGSERAALVENLVRGEVAGVVGYSSGLEVDPSATLKDLGFDSLAAVELRNSLGALTGLRLPATLVFDYPTCAALTGYLLDSLTDEETSAAPAVTVVTHTDEPLAIVGIGCRYPGGVSSAEGLWELVSRGGDGVSDFPTDRGWELDELYDPDPERPGTSYTREGGFLHDATEFDAHFFGIGPREAVAMDPQQRLLLEVSWEALEDAGIDPLSLAGSRTGVFTGVMNHDYGAALVASLSGGEHEGYLGTGVAGSVASGRVAYALGLEGPAMTVDTACSSSLVAMHLACQALRQGECSLALAGGASIHSTPGLFVDFSRQRALSPDGRCKSFSAAADGAGWSEGVGVLVLERLSEARRNGHPVLALVRGSAVNQDGASNGLTAPNGPSQQRVILQALASAGLRPAEIDAVEAHGTGTKLGDPIEAQALIATYARERENDRPLWVGSVKSNIGHALAAAGAAGVIKMVMALKHESLPKTVHAQEPSTEIDWSGAIALLQDSVPWRRNDRKRRAGVSSFGISGTNAHVIIEEAPAELPSAQSVPAVETPRENSEDRAAGVLALGALPLVVSARGDAALRAQAKRLLTHVAGPDQPDPLDVGYSLAVSRAVLEHRAVLVCDERQQLLEDLTALAQGNLSGGVAQGIAAPGGGVAFLFSGQGSQRVGMGRELYGAFQVFREAIDEMSVHLDDHLLEGGEGHRLLDVLFARPDSQTAELIDRTAYTQAGLFVLEVALFRLLASFGLKPSFLLGHSIGELAAAHVAGVFSVQDACKLVAARGRLMENLPAGGAMVALQASELEVGDCLEGLEDRVAVAAVNSPYSTVLSGAEPDILELASLWRERDRKATLLKVSRAFHSPLMDGMLEQFHEVAQTIAFSKPSIPIVSNVTGEVATAELLGSPDYWVRHVREPVRFVDGVGLLAQRGVSCLVELGPGGVLSAISRECLQDPEAELGDDDSRAESGGKRHSEQESGRPAVTVTPLLREGRADGLSLVQGLASAWVSGVDVDWGALYRGSAARRVRLPSYAFQRERFWLGSGPRHRGDVRGVGLASADHPMLGAAVELSGEGWLFTGRLSLQEHSWLADHVVMGKVLLPGTAFLELALHAGARVGCDVVRELVMQAPLVLGERDAVQLQVRVGEVDESGARSLSVSSRVESAAGDDFTAGEDSSEWICHALGLLVGGEYDGGVKSADGVDRGGVVAGDEGAWPPAGAEPVSVEDVYDELAEHGLDYGPAFQGLARAWRSGNEVFAEVLLPDGEIDRAGEFGLHPALLDAALHTMALTESFEDAGASSEVRLPFSWNDVRLVGGGASRLRVRIAPVSEGAVSIAVADESGRPVASIGSLAVRGVSASDFGESNGGQSDMFGVEWVEATVDVSAAGRRSMMFATCSLDVCDSVRSAGFGCEVFADVGSLGEALERGAEYRTVLLDAGVRGPADPREAGAGEDAGTLASGAPLEGMPDAVRMGLHSVLSSLQAWLLDERFSECRMAVVTQGAVAVDVQEDVSDLVGATVWGLVRSAQAENPDRFVLIDVDGEDSCWEVLSHALHLDEPQIVLRHGRVYVARLGSVYGGGVLASPQGGRAWRLGAGLERTLESLALVESPEADGPLAAGEVRVEVRAAGLNFRDVLVALGMYPGEAGVGGEGAGVVVEVGDGVRELALGQRVMGLMDGAMGSVAVADARALVPVPEPWSFAQAASAPLAFATAYHGLVDLAGLKEGERVLVHAAAGGVGIAAVQIARHLGAEVFGTASPGKWDFLRALGTADTHMASSRTLDFRGKFLETTDGEGMDVVLNSLAGEFVDASLDLLVNGGRFLEMGKTDIRDAQELEGKQPGVVYRAFDLMEAGPQRLQEILMELVGLFERGALELLPLTTWNVRRAEQAFRHMSQGQHVGKNVLRLPATIGNDGTVLITGGTVGLGALVARHLAVEHGVRNLLLVSRRGLRASGVGELVEELSRLGAHANVVECDVSDRKQVEQLLAGIPEEHPLDTVIHAAGVIDDGVIGSLTPERVDRVLAAKVDGAWNLHELTIDMDLSAFVLFSSVAATMGGPGQGNYAAANAFLDALAVRRRALGLAGTSIGWGLWAQASDMTGHLSDIDHTRMNRMGVLPLSTERGVALFDAALAANEALIVSARLDMKALRVRARDGELHTLLSELISVRPRDASGFSHGSLAELVAHTAQDRRGPVVLELVRSETARVLGHRTPDAVEAQRPFKEMGFDSLAGVELRNRLAAQTGMRLPATMVFDYPTPEAVAGYLLDEVSAQTSQPAGGASIDLDKLQLTLSGMSAEEAQRNGTVAALQSILSTWASTDDASDTEEPEDDLSSATDEEIFDLIDRDLEVS
ncbi:MAG: SDR family NAD(P)-dependent oxidoreductase [Solirubrobacteraceae bacterium]